MQAFMVVIFSKSRRATQNIPRI